jgi:hypothetical protein
MNNGFPANQKVHNGRTTNGIEGASGPDSLNAGPSGITTVAPVRGSRLTSDDTGRRRDPWTNGAVHGEQPG